MTLLSIELQTDNSASNNDNFCEALIEELRYHDFMKNYVRPRLEE